MRKLNSLVCLVAVLLAGCSARTPGNLSNVGVAGGNGALDNNSPTAQSGERYDPQAEADISEESLAAWRLAVAHAKKGDLTDPDWKKLRDADEIVAMAKLKELLKRHQSSSTVYLMMGQVEEHFGKNKEAVEFLTKATKINTVNSLSLYKLAENERKGGDTKAAIEHYHKLLAAQPDFYPAMVGLAECLIKTNKSEARKLAQTVIDAKPDDEQSLQRARAIVSAN